MAMPHDRNDQINSVLHQVESDLDRDISELYSIQCEADVLPTIQNCTQRAEQSKQALQSILSHE